MKKKVLFSLFVLALLAACSETVFTGRKQMNLIPVSEINQLSFSEYKSFLSQNKPMTSGPEVEMVRRVGNDIKAAVDVYYKAKGLQGDLKNFAWEFNVVDDPTVNAWCMPGGKVVVYTGILPVTQDEAGLAVVMGHEIAHAIARHGNERMSQAIAIQGAGMTLEALTASKPGLTRDLFLQSYGIGSQLGMLAYSRKHETEADKMGLVFMAMAGYDPRSAPAFWQRMAAGGGAKPPAFLSTHPSDETRVHDLEAYMPEALKYFKP